MKRNKTVSGLLGLAAAVSIVFVASTPASAATATFYDGPGCHNVLRTETGATLTQSRTGIRAIGGSTGGLSDLTVWYGDVSTTQNSAEVVVENTSTRTYHRGQFRIDFSGAIDGECAGTSQGMAIDAGAPGSRAAAPEIVDAASVDGWDVSAAEEPASGGVTVTAELDGATYSAVFTDEQASRGEAEILITDHSTGESHSVVYNSSQEVSFSVSATDAVSR